MLRSLPTACIGSSMLAPQRLVSATAPAQRLRACFKATQPYRRRVAPCVRAAMAGAAGSEPDPYEVLGLSPGANTEAVQRSYRRALNDANRADDKARIEKIESAHSRIMMAGLQSRIKGEGASVDKEVRYADRAQFLPWRPRKYVAEDKRFIQIVGALQALLAAWALLSSVTAGTQPLVSSALVGVVANVYKQNMIFPAPAGSSDKNKQTFKNLWRGALLTIIATFAGAFLFFTLPDFAVTTLTQRPMPLWFYQSESTLLCVGACLSNFLFSAFLR